MHPISPTQLASYGSERWLCQLRITAEEFTRRHALSFVPDLGLPGTVLTWAEIDGLVFQFSAVPEAAPPMAWVWALAWDDVRSPRRALEVVLRACGTTVAELETVNEDLAEWPWLMTRDDGRGGRRVAAWLRDAESAQRQLDWLSRRHPTHDYQIEPAPGPPAPSR